VDYPVKTPRQLRPLLVGFRKAAGLTQSQVASHLGVAQQTYAQLEAKPESASMDRLFHVLKLLKVDIVLAQVSSSALPEGHQSERLRTAGPPVAAKQSVAKKRATTPAAKTAAPARRPPPRRAVAGKARRSRPPGSEWHQ
jgi:HTH-type transcriptional regulator/antitoxin HipB